MLAALKARIRDARLRTAVRVNRELILLYWDTTSTTSCCGSPRKAGAPAVIDRLARDLRRDFPEMTGLSPRNLNDMRAFADARPDRAILQQLVAQLPWGHNIRLLEARKLSEERAWYARQPVVHGWSRAVQAHQIEARCLRALKTPSRRRWTDPHAAVAEGWICSFGRIARLVPGWRTMS
ncbi:MAG TPA: DUF1016 N-terminal domain-containing protein [Steroidobacteraceae bacterium]|nr:DUF1016 N-terminal domain-containing protein [Steroidobacteraceae bacterium]